MTKSRSHTIRTLPAVAACLTPGLAPAAAQEESVPSQGDDVCFEAIECGAAASKE